MKFALLPWLAAGAAIANVAAATIRLVFITTESHIETPAGGQAIRPIPVQEPPRFLRRPCGAHPGPQGVPDEEEKALSVSNAFRHAVGWDRIESFPPHPTSHRPVADVDVDAQEEAGFVHILPFPFRNPGAKIFQQDRDGDFHIAQHGHEHHEHHEKHEKHRHHHKEHHHHHHHKHHRPGFWRRIHTALVSLGTWEGRAVAFVLGCGLGVLIRMLAVLTIVMYRAFRPAQETVQYGVIHIYEDAPVSAPAVEEPPTYPADVKVPVPEEKA